MAGVGLLRDEDRRLSELPYVRGEVLADTADDLAKLAAAWRIVERRHRDGTLFDFTGLVRSFEPAEGPYDDELAPALVGERLKELALDHLGGIPGRDDVFVANRLTAAFVAAMQVLVEPGRRVVGVSPSYTHPAVIRAVRLAGGEFVEGGSLHGASLVVLTRLAVTYEALPENELRRVVDSGVPFAVDDAGGARAAPAVLGQPKTLELGGVVGATGLDKYGTIGPRLGLLAGRADLVARIRARATELGLEARPMLYPAVVRSLEQYRPERVRELVDATNAVADELEARMGDVIERTPFAVRIPGEALLRRAGIDDGAVAPIEATAALAMLLLRDHGILTVHFAALPPGTSALLVKFLPPETLGAFGGAELFAAAVEAAIDELPAVLRSSDSLRALLGVRK